MQGAFRLVQHEFIGSTKKERDGLAGVSHAGDLGDLATFNVDLFDKIGMTKLVFCEGINVCNRSAAECLENENENKNKRKHEIEIEIKRADYKNDLS